MRPSIRAAIPLGLWSALAASARAGEELYISLPDLGAIHKFDVDAGTLTPWASNVGVTLYGEWGPDDRLYIADHTRALVWGIAPDGTKSVVSSGGLLDLPLSTCVHPTTGELYVTDFGFQHIVAIDPATGAQRLFCDNSAGLFMVPGGIHFDPQGNLWMTDHGTHDIVVIDPNGVPVEFLDGATNGLHVPAGIEIDRSGNAFVASYEDGYIARLRTDTGELTHFCDDAILTEANDVAFAADGSIYTTTSYTSAIVKIDVHGQSTVLHFGYQLGQFLGIAPRRTAPLSGSMTTFGSGLAGSGGFVPELRGLYTPDLGVTCALEVRHALGGAGGFLMGGLATTTLPLFGGTAYVDFGSGFDLFPVTHDGSGDGNGTLLFEIEIPDDPALAGLPTYWQDFVFDLAAPRKIALSNALELIIGS